jgi:hypothetical protein
MYKELEHGFRVHNPDKNIERRITVWKETDHIRAQFEGVELSITIFPVLKRGRPVDVRVLVEKGDDFYFDEPPSAAVLTVKHKSELSDKEIEEKRYKPKHRHTSMTREFTLAEKKEILKFLHENPKMEPLQVADIFYEKWALQISETGIMCIITEEAIGQLKVD